jgi:hypothetical protein
MPEISADKVIGKTLIAKGFIDKLNFQRQKIGQYKPGDVIGVVRSYVQLGTPNVYWVFGIFNPNNPQSQFLVKHEKGKFEITSEIKTAAQLEKEEEEKILIQQKGAFRYYIEKYGLIVALIIAGTILGKAAIQKK